MAAVKGIQAVWAGQGQHLPQPEGTSLGGHVPTGTEDFDRESVFASLVESGEALKGMADLKYALDDNVKQNYLEPSPPSRRT